MAAPGDHIPATSKVPSWAVPPGRNPVRWVGRAARHAAYLSLAYLPARIAFRRLCKLQVVRDAPVPWGPNVLVIANHRSLVDSWLILDNVFGHLRDLRHYHRGPIHPAAYENFLDTPFKRFLFGRVLKCVPILRGGTDSDVMGTLDALATMLRSGTMIIFPEGSRTRTGYVSPTSRWGVGRVIHRARPVVIPVFHHGSQHVLPVGKGRLTWGHDLFLRVGAPLALEDLLALPDERATWQAISDRTLQSLASMERDFLRDRGEPLPVWFDRAILSLDATSPPRAFEGPRHHQGDEL
jgi:1-acyl-sn-glycerol-3-phosphate acyltransferase